MRFEGFWRWRSIFAFGLMLAVCLCVGGPAQAGKIRDFSADQVAMDGNGKVMHTSKIYSAPEKFRMEGFGPRGGDNMTIIVRKDLMVHYMLTTKKKAYMERPLNEEDLKMTFRDAVKTDQEEDLGTEKVQGYKCRKKRITTTTEFFGQKRKSQSIIWTCDEFDMPLRVQTSDGHVSELRNIKREKQSQDLFEIPAGYTRVSGMMQLMGDVPERADREPSPDQKSKEGEGFKIPESIRKKLPKDFKLPFGNN